MIGLLCVEDTISVCKAVTIEYRNVTDRRTDGRTDERTELLYQYRASVC